MATETGSIPWHWFRSGKSIAIARAPARLDVMGGIADYSGATVLQLPLALGATVAVQTAADGLLTVRTDGPAVPALTHNETSIPAGVLHAGPPGQAPERVRAALLDVGAPWATYVLGPLAMLQAEGVLPQVDGLRLAVWSDVPAGAGISSSAALEVASLRALCALLGIELEPLPMATLAQQAEHRVALAPCGIMDQVASLMGRRDHLLVLRCQPAEVRGHRRLPHDAQVLGIYSGVAHRVAGHQYGRVRTATFMGRAIIASMDPVDPPGGYLCNMSPERFLERYAPHLPEEMWGAEFLARYGETGDDATHVEPEVVYRVRDCTTHPVMEQANIKAFLEGLQGYDAHNLPGLAYSGMAMLRSHKSYGERCELGTPETDLIVDLVRQRIHQVGPLDAGLLGARITGGGGGGTVAILGVGHRARISAEEVAAEYSRRTGNPSRVIAGSGDGALDTPVTFMPAGTGE